MKRLLTHLFILSFILVFFLPLYLAMVVASHDGLTLLQTSLPFLPGHQFMNNFKIVLMQGISTAGGIPVWQMLVNSFIMAMAIAAGKITLALFSAFSLVYFDLPFKRCFFALIFCTMMLPIEVRIGSSFKLWRLWDG